MAPVALIWVSSFGETWGRVVLSTNLQSRLGWRKFFSLRRRLVVAVERERSVSVCVWFICVWSWGSVKCEFSGGDSMSKCVELKRVLWSIHVLHGGEWFIFIFSSSNLLLESGAKVAAGILFWVENSSPMDLQLPSIRGIYAGRPRGGVLVVLFFNIK